MASLPSPTYRLADLQTKVRIGHYQITRRARETAAALGFDEEDVTSCVLDLTEAELYKTMPSDALPGTHQDVYRTTYLGRAVYIKLTMGAPARPTVVVSFKRDTSAAKAHGEGDHDDD